MLVIEPNDKNIRDQIILDWFPYMKCNYRCSYCSSYNKNSDFSLELFEKFYDYLKLQNHNILLKILGGEPSLIPNINYILNKLSSLNIDIVMFTNGSRHIVTPKNISLNISIHYEYISEAYINNIINLIKKQNQKPTVLFNIRNDLEPNIKQKIIDCYNIIKEQDCYICVLII